MVFSRQTFFFLFFLALAMFITGCDSVTVTVPDTDTLRFLNCASGKIAKVNSSNLWECANDNSAAGGDKWSLSNDGWVINDSDDLNWNESKGDNRYYLNTNLRNYTNFTDLDRGGFPNTSAEVVALFTGCSGDEYLGADGACHVDDDNQIADNFWPVFRLYIYNDSGTLRLNETLLNETIDALDDVGGFSYDDNFDQGLNKSNEVTHTQFNLRSQVPTIRFNSSLSDSWWNILFDDTINRLQFVYNGTVKFYIDNNEVYTPANIESKSLNTTNITVYGNITINDNAGNQAKFYFNDQGHFVIEVN